MHTLAVIAEFGSGELPAPHDVAMGDQVRLMVADTVNNRVAILELNGVTGRLVGSAQRRARTAGGNGSGA